MKEVNNTEIGSLSTKNFFRGNEKQSLPNIFWKEQFIRDFGDLVSKKTNIDDVVNYEWLYKIARKYLTKEIGYPIHGYESLDLYCLIEALQYFEEQSWMKCVFDGALDVDRFKVPKYHLFLRYLKYFPTEEIENDRFLVLTKELIYDLEKIGVIKHLLKCLYDLVAIDSDKLEKAQKEKCRKCFGLTFNIYYYISQGKLDPQKKQNWFTGY